MLKSNNSVTDSQGKKVIAVSAVVGLLYGLLCRLIFGLKQGGDAYAIMSSTFIIGVPVIIGFLAVMVSTRYYSPKIESPFTLLFMSLILPWGGALSFLFCSFIFLWEGLICIILWLPMVMILSSVGGFLGGIFRLIIYKQKTRNYCIGFFALLPFLIAPAEQLRERATDIREVHSSIDIEATAEAVWLQIRSVPEINDSEHRSEIIHRLGFPRPLAARLEGEGVGSVRYATFEGDVLFIEKVTEWVPNESIAFTIEADTENIPPDTFDQHVTVGGPYFDVLDGRYWIETLDAGLVRLHLESNQRLSTGFNFYSHLWTEWLMDRMQTYILVIIKERAEAAI
jgi:hypothetical protein